MMIKKLTNYYNSKLTFKQIVFRELTTKQWIWSKSILLYMILWCSFLIILFINPKVTLILMALGLIDMSLSYKKVGILNLILKKKDALTKLKLSEKLSKPISEVNISSDLLKYRVKKINRFFRKNQLKIEGSLQRLDVIESSTMNPSILFHSAIIVAITTSFLILMDGFVDLKEIAEFLKNLWGNNQESDITLQKIWIVLAVSFIFITVLCIHLIPITFVKIYFDKRFRTFKELKEVLEYIEFKKVKKKKSK